MKHPNEDMNGYLNNHRYPWRNLCIELALLVVQLNPTAYSSNDAYDSGHDHRCYDAGISNPDDRYINQPEKGPAFHTGRFMDGYNNGFNACSGNSRGGNGGSEEDGGGNDGE